LAFGVAFFAEGAAARARRGRRIMTSGTTWAMAGLAFSRANSPPDTVAANAFTSR
jgi:hypothetical protein